MHLAHKAYNECMATKIQMSDNMMAKMAMTFWTWAEMYPVYAERMAAMSHPFNVDNAFIDASFLTLQPKE